MMAGGIAGVCMILMVARDRQGMILWYIWYQYQARVTITLQKNINGHRPPSSTVVIVLFNYLDYYVLLSTVL